MEECPVDKRSPLDSGKAVVYAAEGEGEKEMVIDRVEE
jgi:hypothetical protein